LTKSNRSTSERLQSVMTAEGIRRFEHQVVETCRAWLEKLWLLFVHAVAAAVNVESEGSLAYSDGEDARDLPGMRPERSAVNTASRADFYLCLADVHHAASA
jgi:hypothetical protein